MELLQGIISTAVDIYALYDQTQWNKKQCGRLVGRIKILMMPVQSLQKQSQINKDTGTVLEELSQTMQNAKRLVAKYTQRVWWKRFFWAFGIKANFDLINQRLSDASQGLALMLNVQDREIFLKMLEDVNCETQNKEDVEADLEELKQHFEKGLDNVSDQVDQMHKDVNHGMQQMMNNLEDVKKMLVQQTNPSAFIATEIKKEDLTRREKLMETGSSILYRGEYHKSVVAIKHFQEPLTDDADSVKKIFLNEVKTMKGFEHPNILHMYGICIDKTGPVPSFSIVMEYCEKGTLRELLKKEQNLTWENRIRMSQGAALGLYRLHQTKDKFVVHGNLSSAKFLVDSRYCVKLAGFELSKTETSIKRTSNTGRQMEVHDSAYLSPQALGSVNFIQDKPSEIYSFGIVLWEIAARSTPFRGLTTKQIFQKVAEEKYQEPLPEDCPQELQALINQCRLSVPEERPSAGAVADKLMGILNKEMEEHS
ncbi:mixed lineage kinase domain-like protein [Rhinatrema bivittatum]|uniref:mixed lineage kinase domain-like protein n=1 Tax=Rhinatrema bivittatum TaxID=194408 RepID=UPI00112CBA25|nr:mixed lineage kinase domain-like protein [Rhinatrema bivittatum]XP_029464742.1 mixed lineage kinase domain-like protein [Rhinatrema bivittatum]XP_029464743.1 mixed lineage kinase domain-like protein [Rhinatrema bivittatum]